MLGHRALNMEEYLRILQRRAWIFVAPTLLLAAIAFGLSFLITPKYISQTTMLLVPQKDLGADGKPLVPADLDSRVAAIKTQVLSQAHLRPIVERYDLYAGRHLSIDARVAKTRSSIAIRPATPEMTHSSGLPGALVSFEAGDPHTAQLVCGEIISVFLGDHLPAAEAQPNEAHGPPTSQLAVAKRNLDAQQAKLAEFQQQNSGKLPGEESPNFKMFTILSTQLEATVQDLAGMEQARNERQPVPAQRVPASVAPSSPGSPKGALGDQAELQALLAQTEQAELKVLLSQEADLSSQYSGDYPEVIELKRQIADLRKRMAAQTVGGRAPETATSLHAEAPAPAAEAPAPRQMRASLRALDLAIAAKRKEQAGLEAQIRVYQDRIQASPRVGPEYKALTRDYQAAQTFYDDLLTKISQSGTATEPVPALVSEQRQEGEQFRVMDEPTLPTSPASPKRGLFLTAGFAGGLALGSLIVVLLEYKDTALRSERDVWAFTKLPTLGTIGFFDEAEQAAAAEASQRINLRRRDAKQPLTEVGG